MAISKRTKDAVRRALKRGDRITDVARKYGVAKSTVCGIKNPGAAKAKLRVEGILFRQQDEAYLCRFCCAWTTWRPCPTCIARRAKSAGVPSALRNDAAVESGPRTMQSATDSVFGAVPKEVFDWLRSEVSRRVSPGSSPSVLDDSVEDLVARIGMVVRVLAAEAAGPERK